MPIAEGLQSPIRLPTKTILAVEPPALIFNKSQATEFSTHLSNQSRTSRLETIDKPSQLVMNADGLLGGGFKATTSALYQICHTACPGLYKMIVELLKDGSDEGRQAAVNIYNQLIRLRFRKTFFGRSLLYDVESKLVEAFVGLTYQAISNFDLYTTIQDALESEDLFYEGVIKGRWISVRFYRRSSKFEIPTLKESFFTGFHFSNHEGGMASFKGANLIVRVAEKLAFLTPSKAEARVRHQGDQFFKRIKLLVSSILSNSPDVRSFVAGVESLASTSLGLGCLLQAEETKRQRSLARQLHRFEVNRELASRIVANVLVQSRTQTTTKSVYTITNQDLATRSVFDLVCSLCRSASATTISIREELERLAYLFCTLKLKVK